MESIPQKTESLNPDGYDARALENKSVEELKQDLENLRELDDKLDPDKRVTFKGKDVALSLLGGGVFSSAVYLGLSSAGAVFTLANPMAGLVVLATATTGTYISGKMTRSHNKTQAFKEWRVKVIEPKLHVLRALRERGALNGEQKAEYVRLLGEYKTLKERQARATEELKKVEDSARDEALQLLEGEKQKLLEVEDAFGEKVALLENRLEALQAEKARLEENIKLRGTESSANAEKIEELNHQAEINQKKEQFDSLTKQQHQLKLKDAALTVSYKLALQEKKKAQEIIRQRDEELIKANEEFKTAQNEWNITKAGFEECLNQALFSKNKLSKELEVLSAAEKQLKAEAEETSKDLTRYEKILKEKDFILEQDKHKLAQLQQEKEKTESAVKRIETEKDELQLLFNKLEDARQELEDAHSMLKKERDQILLNFEESEAGRQAVDMQLAELKAEFEEAKQHFDTEKERLELTHKQQIKEKEDHFQRLEKKLRRGTTFQKAKTILALYALESVKNAKADALKRIEHQGQQLESQQRQLENQQQELENQRKELDDLRNEKETLNKKIERLHKANLRQVERAAGREEGNRRSVGDRSTRLNINLFDLDNITDKNVQFEDVSINPEDMVGLAAKQALTDGLKDAQQKLKQAHDQAHEPYSPVHDGMPTLSGRREKMKAGLHQFKQDLFHVKAVFKTKSGEAKAREALLKNLDETVDVVDAGIRKVSGEEEQFQSDSVEADKLLSDVIASIDGASIKDMGDRTYSAFLSVDHPSQEVRDLARAHLVETLAEKYRETSPKQLPASNDIDALEQMREELEEKKRVLQQFHHDSLPLDTGKSVSLRCKEYLDHTIKTCTDSLNDRCRTSKPQKEEFSVKPRNEGGMHLARRMLANPAVCAEVYSWFSSLQDRHEGIKKSKDSFDYYTASTSGLEVIRHDHGLVYMPTPSELLSAIKADLGEVDSKFTTEACRQHRGTTRDSQGVWRREKLVDRCDAYLAKEDLGDRLRGHPRSVVGKIIDVPPSTSKTESEYQDELVPHAHKDVLDCFAEADGCRDVHFQDTSRTDESAFYVYPVRSDAKGLMNTFFEGCTGQARLRIDKNTQEEFLSVDTHNVKPKPLVFKKTQQGWKVSLGGANWWVDPSMITQNPELNVPFEWKNGQQLQRDWIPLRDAQGNTSILVLRKSPAMGDRYFMYQPGGNGLIPRPIGSSDFQRERVEAGLLYMAALSGHKVRADRTNYDSLNSGEFQLHSLESDSSTSLVTQRDQIRAGNADKEVIQITNMSRGWAKRADRKQLVADYSVLLAQSGHTQHLAPLQSHSLDEVLSEMEVPSNELREITREKRGRQKAIQTYAKARFSTFSVGAGFDTASDKYFDELRKRSGGEESPVVDAQHRQCQEYREGVFRDLQVFKGCELDDTAFPDGEGAPAQVQSNFAKVVKQNTDHCIRMQQQVDRIRQRLIKKIRTAHDGELGRYTDQQVLDKAVMEFEKGNIVNGVYDNGETKNIQLFVLWMQAENDLRLHSKVKQKLTALDGQLADIKKDAPVQQDEDFMAYRNRCQSWNLEMALVASEMQVLQERLDAYKGRALDPATRAIMSFERRAQTVLRSGVGSDQVREVESAISNITLAMKEGKNMARVSQLGTGWGKSTMLQLWTDLACSLNVGRSDRSVMVIAPTRNKLDLDRMLARYYDQKGLEYQSLDLMAQYIDPAAARPNSKWWQGSTLVEIHNRLLGVPVSCPESDRAEMVQKMRAPVGASIQDVQILVHLRRKLQSQQSLNAEDKTALRRLDGIVDLFRESMIFADEWDSALVPPLPHELEEVKDNVNQALRPLGGGDIATNDITHGHGTFIFGCKRKHLLSATTGTTYTAAVASGATQIDDVAQKCNTDPYTTSARVWHLLGMAEPVMVDSGKGELKQQVYDKVVGQIGADRPVMLFNSHADGQDNFNQAVENFAYLSRAREKAGKSSHQQKGMLYYDSSKTLCQYLPGDARYDGNFGRSKDVPLTREDEELIRANGGNMVDVCLGQSESVGTDAPQCLDSAGVFVGLFEQKENGRFDLAAQQMGRLTRATRSMRKPQQFFMVVDKEAIRKLDKSPERDDYLDRYEKLEEKTQNFSSMFTGGMPRAVVQAVNASINVEPAKRDRTISIENSIKRNLESELQNLEDTQWIKLNLNDRQAQALRELKIAQWEAKVRYLELAGKELAIRDVNEHTRACEQTLEQAAVDSAMEKAYSEEDNWLKNLSSEGEVLDRFNFGAADADMPVDPKTDLLNAETGLTKRFIREGMVVEASQRLGSLPRRTVTEGVKMGALSACFEPGPMSHDISRTFARIRDDGVKFEMRSPVDEVHASLKKGALEALEDARQRVKTIYDGVCRESGGRDSYPKNHNRALLDPLIDIIEKQIDDVGDKGNFDKAINTSVFLEKFYKRLFCAVSYLAISEFEKSIKVNVIKNQLKGVWKAGELKIADRNEQKNFSKLIDESIKHFPDYVPESDYRILVPRLTTNRLRWEPIAEAKKSRPKAASKSSVGSSEVKGMPWMELKSPKNNVVRKADNARANLRGRILEMQATPNFNHDFNWKAPSTSRLSLSDTEGSYKRLVEECKAGKSARYKLDCWEQAKQFCEPGSLAFKACVDEMEQAILAQYDELQHDIRSDLLKEDQDIQAQHQLMA